MNEKEIDAPVKRPYVADLGNFNCLPTPCVECDLREFWYVWQSWGAEIEYRQVYFSKRTGKPLTPDENRRDSQMYTTRIMWFHDRAYALLFPHGWKTENQTLITTEHPRCFRIGCQHQYRELSQQECRSLGISHHGRCYHVNKCSLCGQIDAYDSGD